MPAAAAFGLPLSSILILPFFIPMAILTRRSFLQISAAAGVAAATAPFASRLGATPAPFARSGAPRLRLSLTAMSFSRYFTINRGKAVAVAPDKALDVFKFVDYCAAHGCDAEPTTYFFAEETDEFLARLRRHCFLRGVSITSAPISNNFSLPKGPAREQDIAHVKRWIDRAVVLGAPQVRVFVGQTDASSREEADKLVIAGLEECGDYAGRHGIILCVENHDVTNTAARLLPIIKAVKNSFVGLNLDPGMAVADPYQEFAACLPYAVNIHVKTDLNVAGKRQPMDFPRIARLLRDGGYQGWVALKYESQEDPYVAVPRTLQDMKPLFAG